MSANRAVNYSGHRCGTTLFIITAALTRHYGNISKAAEEMGMYRQHLQLKLAEYEIDAELYRKS